MKLGTIIGIPDEYTRFARVLDNNSGIAYTVPPKKLYEEADVDHSAAYSVEIWSNDSGLVHIIEED